MVIKVALVFSSKVEDNRKAGNAKATAISGVESVDLLDSILSRGSASGQATLEIVPIR